MRIELTNRGEAGWRQFQRMVLGGVPHAVAIARALAGSSLTVPAAPDFDPGQADLPFYAPVHQAYRLGVLNQFLGLMEHLRSHPLWEHFKNSRSAQTAMVQDCSANSGRGPSASAAQVDHWFGLAASDCGLLKASVVLPPSHFQPSSRAA